MQEEAEIPNFNRDLQDYWNLKNLVNIKVPQIGGQNLDFYKLYRAVVKRGGAIAVSKGKLWKEIVNEFGLPNTCTSASFTLRNHYDRYLFGFEQKYHFGIEGADLAQSEISKLSKKQKKKGENDENLEESGSNEGSDSEESNENKEQNKFQQKDSKNSDLGQYLGQQLKGYEKKNGIYYVKRSKLSTSICEIKRIMLAFDSRMPDEITYAINSLLLFSVNQTKPFLLETYPSLIESMTNYIESVLQNIPYLKNAIHIKEIMSKITEEESINPKNESAPLIQCLSILDNYNYPIHQIMSFNKKNSQKDSGPISLLQKRRREEKITTDYTVLGQFILLEQLRHLILIVRNMVYNKSNELTILKNEKLCHLLLQLYILNNDMELHKNLLEILTFISKHLVLSNVVDYENLIQKLINSINGENYEEVDASIDCFRNMIALQENESYIEQFLDKYIDSIEKLLQYAQREFREGVLEFLCHLSDLKMQTRIKLASRPKLINRLIGLMATGCNPINEKIVKLSAYTLNNLSVAPASRPYLIPFEKELFIIAATDESISQLLGNILADLAPHNE